MVWIDEKTEKGKFFNRRNVKLYGLVGRDAVFDSSRLSVRITEDDRILLTAGEPAVEIIVEFDDILDWKLLESISVGYTRLAGKPDGPLLGWEPWSIAEHVICSYGRVRFFLDPPIVKDDPQFGVKVELLSGAFFTTATLP